MPNKEFCYQIKVFYLKIYDKYIQKERKRKINPVINPIFLSI